MDRYQLAREFEFTKERDHIRRIDDVDMLRKCALDMHDLNYRLRSYVVEMTKRELGIDKLSPGE